MVRVFTEDTHVQHVRNWIFVSCYVSQSDSDFEEVKLGSEMATKQLTLIVVRHGQATHNLDTFQRKDLVLTDEPDRPIMNSPLTELGRQQAYLVANRLADTKFHLGFASDLTRASDTAQAIVAANPSLDDVKECRFLRERNAGIFEGDHDLLKAQCTVEYAIEDRDLLTWRIPEGDSIVDLRERVQAGINLVQAEALALEVENPTILLASHYVWMHELYHILSEISVTLGDEKRAAKPRTPNTGVDRYILTTRCREEGGKPELEKIVFDLVSCGRHLDAVSSY